MRDINEKTRILRLQIFTAFMQMKSFPSGFSDGSSIRGLAHGE